MLQQRGIIDIKRNPADPADDVFTIFIIKNPNILRDQTMEGIECDPADGSFHAMFAQLFHDQPTPFLAKPFFRKIPAAAGQSAERENGKKPDRADEDPTDHRATALLRNVSDLRIGMQVLSFAAVIFSIRRQTRFADKS